MTDATRDALLLAVARALVELDTECALASAGEGESMLTFNAYQDLHGALSRAEEETKPS